MTSSRPATTGCPWRHRLAPAGQADQGPLFALLREVDPDAADWADRVRRSRPLVPSVVVVGETNRGKSSLV
ncbi:hypothetical protein, partial [Saccharopolyspora gregorii]|uniref:hypothetical protein n=1 Tax=Saccharopolyspora gregorii TaxID=33914 RepID=UPI0031E67F93